MTATRFTESEVEDLALQLLEQELEYQVLRGPDIGPGEALEERVSFDDVVLRARLRSAIDHLNLDIPSDARGEALKKVIRLDAPTLVASNQALHRMLVDGVKVEYKRDEGSIAGDHVALIDCSDPFNNDSVAVNQFTVTEGQSNRRPDVVIFVNGLPLGVIELKNPADEEADAWSAFGNSLAAQRIANGRGAGI